MAGPRCTVYWSVMKSSSAGVAPVSCAVSEAESNIIEWSVVALRGAVRAAALDTEDTRGADAARGELALSPVTAALAVVPVAVCRLRRAVAGRWAAVGDRAVAAVLVDMVVDTVAVPVTVTAVSVRVDSWSATFTRKVVYWPALPIPPSAA